MATTKERNTGFVTARVNPNHRERIQAIADKEERKMSEIVRRAIKVYLESLDAEKN